MKPAIFSVIGQRLIPRVDDRAIELHPLIDVVHDVIGPLAKLKMDLRLPVAAAQSRTRVDWTVRHAPPR